MSAFEKVFTGQPMSSLGFYVCVDDCPHFERDERPRGDGPIVGFCRAVAPVVGQVRHWTPCLLWARWAASELEDARSTAAAALKVIGTSVPSSHEGPRPTGRPSAAEVAHAVREREMASCEHRWLSPGRGVDYCGECGKVRLVRRVTGAAEDPAWRELADQAKPDLDRWDAEGGR